MGRFRRTTGRFGSVPVAIVLATACSQNQPPAANPLSSVPMELSSTYVFRCDGNFRFSIQLQADSAALQIGARTLTLQKTAAADGDSYSAEGYDFSNQGLIAALATPGRSYQGCPGTIAETPWDKAAMLGYEYRAVGQEPGWVVEVDAEDHIRVILDYGETDFTTPRPRPVFDVDDVTSYQASVDGRDVLVTITEVPCVDTMSGDSLPTSTVLRVGDRTLEGCGGFLADQLGPELDGPIWSLIELGGLRVQPLVEGMQTYVQFNVETRQVAGFTGCNNIVGLFTLFGDQLRFREPIAATRMGCSDNIAANRERSFLNALQRTSRYAVVDDVLTLYAGNQVVARFAAQR